MIDIWAAFFVKLHVKLSGREPLQILGMNSNAEQKLFSPNILSLHASNHDRIAELKAIQCYQSAHPIAASGLVVHPADISLVKSKSGKALP
jgi:hypothetical protein